MSDRKEIYYRWALINNQETCYTRVVELLEGFFKSEEEVKAFYKDEISFEENLFGVRSLDFSATPKWLAEGTGEFLG